VKLSMLMLSILSILMLLILFYCQYSYRAQCYTASCQSYRYC
jgi:hypothetical protein